MTKQITPIDIYNSTWGDALDRVNELIDAANTEFVTIGGVNEGNVSITGTLEANNLGIDNFQANTSTIGSLNAGTAVANTLTAETVTSNAAVITNANVTANLTANVVGGNFVVANTIIAGPVYDANGNLISANTLITKDQIIAPAMVANTLQVTGTLLIERIGQNFIANVATFSRVNSNTVDAGIVNANTIRVSNRDNLQKLSVFDYLPSRVLGTDANTNVIQYAISVFGQSLLSSPNAANTRALVGLDQVNNTSDSAKPISVATQAALDLKTDKATRVNAGTGLTGGGALAANVTISLSANTIASLAKADTAVQGNNAALVPSGGVFGQVLMKQSTDPYDYAWTTSAITTAIQFVPQTLTPEQQAQGRENLGLGTALSDYIRRDGASQITGELKTTAANGLRIQHNASNTSMMLRYDGTDGYILFSNTTTGSFTASRPIRINYETGAVTFGTKLISNTEIIAKSGTNSAQSFPLSFGYANSSVSHWKTVLETDGSLSFASYNLSTGVWNRTPITFSYNEPNAMTVNGDIRIGASAWLYVGGANMRPDGQINGTVYGGNLTDWVNGRCNAYISGSMNGRAYPRRVGGGDINFNWSGQGGQPTWLWGGTDGTNMYVYNPANFSVNYANNAGAVGGWSIDSIRGEINWRVSDARFAGYLEYQSSERGATAPWQQSSGYVITGTRRIDTDRYLFAHRQPQIYIPNVGWRALGGW